MQTNYLTTQPSLYPPDYHDAPDPICHGCRADMTFDGKEWACPDCGETLSESKDE